ncbi:hypothetical protein BW721_04810 [Jeotgalibaca sp. PTS2502]|nr:hypothetical protein BW721_04810 [Jeotgalibaca sp. PTS2502]
MYENYFDNYHGRKVTIETSYKPLLRFDIIFNETDLPHLLGLHKLDKDSASKQLDKIKSGELTYQVIKKRDGFHQIKDRIKHIDFINRVFLTREVRQCICVSKEDSKNSMRLDIVFMEDSIQRVLNLGLRKVSNQRNVYTPVTFFVSKSKGTAYPYSKRAKIKSLEWDEKVLLMEKAKIQNKNS